MYTGWDATVYVNEETKHRRTNPGRSAVLAVAFLAIIYTFCEFGLQGVVSPSKLQANSSAPLIFIAQSLGGGGWSKVMALSLALSVIASTGTAIVIIARMAYGMAIHRVLPPALGNVNRRFSTPVVASITIGGILIVATWVYLLSTSVANVFDQVIDITGLLYAAFYILTALAAVVYYRRRIFSKIWDAILVGILPLAGAGFLAWIIYKSLDGAAASEVWSVVGIVAAGFILMLIARFWLRSAFFQIPLESAPKED
jgi:amino acid transporter